MVKKLLILANSRKNSGRCVAGKDENGKWFRITKNGGGAIPTSEANHYDILKVVEFDGVVNKPGVKLTYHSEDSIYTGAKVLGTIDLENLDAYLDTPNTIFGPDRQLKWEDANKIGHSLLFVKVQNLSIERVDDGGSNIKLRAEFTYNGMLYTDISVTDAFFESKFKAFDYSHTEEYDEAYITVSLGIPYFGRTYKLISGIIVA